MHERHILVAGASGVVGFAALKQFARRPDWKVTGVSRRRPFDLHGATFISVDLDDAARCAAVFGEMRDVTHVVYAALHEQPGLLQSWHAREQMDTNLRMLRHLFEPLEAAARDLRHVTLLQGTKAYGAHLGPIAVPARERSPRHQHENFYWLQEDYLREKQRGRAWHWTILRPQIVFGESLGSHMNAIPAIGVYAAVRRAAALPLSFPGGPPTVTEAVDADLLARACEWAATTAACANETFNITNGDVFVWPQVWPAIAAALGMDVGPPEPHFLARAMPAHEAAWAAIVRQYDLRAPTTLREFVGQSFAYADAIFASGSSAPPPPVLVSTIKARQAGLHDCMDTEAMFRKWFRRFQDLRLLPPVDS